MKKEHTNKLLKWEKIMITQQVICWILRTFHYKLIAIDLSQQIELENPDLKQQINFTGKHKDDKTTEQQCFSSLKSQKKQFLNFHKTLQQLFDFYYI